MEPRTENILGAFVIAVFVSIIIAVTGWGLPNYYVYFKHTISQVEACPPSPQKE